MESFVFKYDGNIENLEKVFDLNDRGVKILCPVCRNELLVAKDQASAAKQRCLTGVFCPNDYRHVYVRIILEDDPSHEVRRRMYQRAEEYDRLQALKKTAEN